ncbi:Uncharacterised protein [Enterobacter roggenkampii]|uniref:Uncharacterized protein n=1 Tax=Enterobacter roggenkampii TaxID=1812935 RepID=A0ABD7KNP4_9ENTR|nr:Uncharacterised protein [Enterobacter roggenkampii]
MGFPQSGKKDTTIEQCAYHRPYPCTQSLQFYKTHEHQHLLSILGKTYNLHLYAQHLVNRSENSHKQHKYPYSVSLH